MKSTRILITLALGLAFMTPGAIPGANAYACTADLPDAVDDGREQVIDAVNDLDPGSRRDRFDPWDCIPGQTGGVSCYDLESPVCVTLDPIKMSASQGECDIALFPTKCTAALVSFAGGNIHATLAIPGPDAKFDAEFNAAIAVGGVVFAALLPLDKCPPSVCTLVLGASADSYLLTSSWAIIDQDSCQLSHEFPKAKNCLADSTGFGSGSNCAQYGNAAATASNGIPPVVSSAIWLANSKSCSAARTQDNQAPELLRNADPAVQAAVRDSLMQTFRNLLEESFVDGPDGELKNQLIDSLLVQIEAQLGDTELRPNKVTV